MEVRFWGAQVYTIVHHNCMYLLTFIFDSMSTLSYQLPPWYMNIVDIYLNDAPRGCPKSVAVIGCRDIESPA